MQEHQRRVEFTNQKVGLLKDQLQDARKFIGTDACVYATGSYGRLEASEYSDLDLFIVGLSKSTNKNDKDFLESRLSRLNEICIKADLIEATRALNIQEFDGDGRYLVHYAVGQLVGALGTPEDDANNTFTARLLMMLEGRPLAGDQVFSQAIDDLITAYWRDYEDHKNNFVPAFFANDVLRLWRTFCVNYEARTTNIPHEKNLKRRLKNYKLKHSRLITCFSALLSIMQISNQNGTVSPKDMTRICAMTPVGRMLALVEDRSASAAHSALKRAMDQYVRFLEITNEPEAILLRKFDNATMRSALMKDAHSFATAVFDACQAIGAEGKMHRILLV